MNSTKRFANALPPLDDFRNSPFFSKTLPTHLQEIAKHRDRIAFQEGTVLPFRRVAGLGFYCILSGCLRLELQESSEMKAIRFCAPGDIVGYGGWSIGEPFYRVVDSYQLRALDDGEAHFYTKESIEYLQGALPEINTLLIQSLCRLLFLKDERIAALEHTSNKGRVIGLLLNLSNRFGKETEKGILLDLSMDRKTMAQLAGIAPESLSRVLTHLEDDKLIIREKRLLIIPSIAHLTKALETA